MKSGAWSADSNDLNQFIQVDLRDNHIVSGVITQGIDSDKYDEWVTSYEVQYSLDEVTWTAAKKAQDGFKVFLVYFNPPSFLIFNDYSFSVVPLFLFV